MPEAPRSPQEVREQVMNIQQAHTKMLMRLAKEIELLRKEVKTDIAALSRKIDELNASFQE